MTRASQTPARRVLPERKVIATGISPMNPKVKWVELECGHQVWRNRKPRIGAMAICDRCAVEGGDD